MVRTYSKNEGQYVDQTLHRVETKEREEIKSTTKHKMAKRHNKEEGNHLEQESTRQKIMEDTDRGPHPAMEGQSLGDMSERWKAFCQRNKPGLDKGFYPDCILLI